MLQVMGVCGWNPSSLPFEDGIQNMVNKLTAVVGWSPNLGDS